MNVRLLLRRPALAGSGLTFGFIALASIVAPTTVAARYAFTVGSADAYSEFHAVFTGFWLGLFALMITAARRPEDQRLGDLCGVAIGLQATARFFSMAAHGLPSMSFVSAAAGEAVTALVILQYRPAAPRP